MTLDLLHAEAITGGEPAGLVTTGGTGSIAHAILAYRERGGRAGRHPAQRHQARDRPPGLRQGLPPLRRRAAEGPGRPEDDAGRRRLGREHIDDQTVALIGSACNYGYGTVDPIDELCDLALDRGVGLHVDGCLGGFILPFGQELGYDIPVFDYRVDGGDVDLGRHPQVRLRPEGHLGAHLPGQGPAQRPVLLPDRLERGQVLLAGHGGLALGRAHRRHLGRHGPARARGLPPVRQGRSSPSRPPCRPPCASHPELRILGQPTFLFSFTSDEFDIYLVNDFMRTRGWRFNGQQYPNALHMAVTRPQTQPGPGRGVRHRPGRRRRLRP